MKDQVNEKKYRKIKKALDKEFALHDLDTVSNSSSDLEINTSFEIHPLNHYIDDRESLILHMFATIKGSKLKKMIPPSLKHLSTEELKADALIQLLGLSKKRILHIMDGKELNSSSDEDSDSSDSSLDIEKEAKALKLLQEKTKKANNVKTKDKGKKRKSEDQESLKKKKKRKDNDVINISEDEKEDEEAGKQKLIELIELEMRARAIRKLLGENDEEVVIKKEENSDDDIQDLTDDVDDMNNVKIKQEKEEESTIKATTSKNNNELLSTLQKVSDQIAKRKSDGETIPNSTNNKTTTSNETSFNKKRIRLNRTHLRNNYTISNKPSSESDAKTNVNVQKPEANSSTKVDIKIENSTNNKIKPLKNGNNKNVEPNVTKVVLIKTGSAAKTSAVKTTTSSSENKDDNSTTNNSSTDLILNEKEKMVTKIKNNKVADKKTVKNVAGKVIPKRDTANKIQSNKNNSKNVKNIKAVKQCNGVEMSTEKKVNSDVKTDETNNYSSESTEIQEIKDNSIVPNKQCLEVDESSKETENIDDEKDLTVVKETNDKNGEEGTELSEGEIDDDEHNEPADAPEIITDNKESEEEEGEISDNGDDEDEVKEIEPEIIVKETKRKSKKKSTDEKKRKKKKRKTSDSDVELVEEQKIVEIIEVDGDTEEDEDVDNDFRKGKVEEDLKEMEETKNGENQEETPVSWQKRWLESKDVQKIVTTSKMCTNIRKRMRFANMMKAKQSQIAKNIAETTNTKVGNFSTNEEISNEIGESTSPLDPESQNSNSNN